ncbi:MAG: hypothetical protein IJ794_13420 [Lachnospiraceae bacterium]|nr:hypothetical protein [Lachnospiraceae bacterium]
MACFAAPLAESLVVKAVEVHEEKREREAGEKSIVLGKEERIPLSRKLKWLNGMLWGGSALLAFEHVWHGEIVPWFPFLTAMANPVDAAEMLHEIATVGVSMAALITGVWFVMCKVADSLMKQSEGQMVKNPVNRQ